MNATVKAGFNVGDSVRLIVAAYGYAPGLRVMLPAGSIGEIIVVTYGAYILDVAGYRATVTPDAIEAVAE